MSMDVRIEIVDGPLGAARHTPRPAGAGAVVVFEGVVRPEEGGSTIVALDYEAYMPMAARQLEALAHEVGGAHGLGLIHVEHSTGHVPAGACSFRLTVGAAHRAEALGAMSEFIDRMKRDVPIWKRDASGA
jgi:molybdopterin synthase catalytic subunit